MAMGGISLHYSRSTTVLVLGLLWLAVAAASGTVAAALYKCVDARGHVSYQSQACAAGSRQVWVQDTAPEVTAQASPAVPQAGQAEKQASAASSVPGQSRPRLPASRAQASPRADRSAACQRAHAADAAYRAQPLSRVKHDGLRRHGDRIRAACG